LILPPLNGNDYVHESGVIDENGCYVRESLRKSVRGHDHGKTDCGGCQSLLKKGVHESGAIDENGCSVRESLQKSVHGHGRSDCGHFVLLQHLHYMRYDCDDDHERNDCGGRYFLLQQLHQAKHDHDDDHERSDCDHFLLPQKVHYTRHDHDDDHEMNGCGGHSFLP